MAASYLHALPWPPMACSKVHTPRHQITEGPVCPCCVTSRGLRVQLAVQAFQVGALLYQVELDLLGSKSPWFELGLQISWEPIFGSQLIWAQQ